MENSTMAPYHDGDGVEVLRSPVAPFFFSPWHSVDYIWSWYLLVLFFWQVGRRQWDTAGTFAALFHLHIWHMFQVIFCVIVCCYESLLTLQTRDSPYMHVGSFPLAPKSLILSYVCYPWQQGVAVWPIRYGCCLSLVRPVMRNLVQESGNDVFSTLSMHHIWFLRTHASCCYCLLLAIELTYQYHSHLIHLTLSLLWLIFTRCICVLYVKRHLEWTLQLLSHSTWVT